MVATFGRQLRQGGHRPAEAAQVVAVAVAEPVLAGPADSAARHEAVRAGEVGRVVEGPEGVLASGSVPGLRRKERADGGPARGIAAEPCLRAAEPARHA